MSERLVVIGPGRVGTVLAGAWARAGHRVVGAAGGSEASRSRFAERYVASRTASAPEDLVPGASLVLVSTPDAAIEETVTRLAVADVLAEGHKVVHVAGAYGLAPLRRAALTGARIAAIHPAQTVPSADASPDDLVGAAWAVTASEPDRGWSRDLVVDAGGDPYDVPDAARVLYHAALTVGSNAVGAAVAVARQLLLGAGVADPAAFLAPLVQNSVGNVLQRGAEALTGPVVRGDAGTVARHVAQLDADVPELAAAYRHLVEVILGQARHRLEPAQLAAVREALEAARPGSH